MGEEVQNYRYCPRCGNIFPSGKCYCGWSQSFEINPKWGITRQKRDEMYALLNMEKLHANSFMINGMNFVNLLLKRL